MIGTLFTFLLAASASLAAPAAPPLHPGTEARLSPNGAHRLADSNPALSEREVSTWTFTFTKLDTNVWTCDDSGDAWTLPEGYRYFWMVCDEFKVTFFPGEGVSIGREDTGVYRQACTLVDGSDTEFTCPGVRGR